MIFSIRFVFRYIGICPTSIAQTFLLIIALSFGCSSKQEVTETDISNWKETLSDQPELLDGRQLSYLYCSNCHKYPGPELLPASIWDQQVFPVMGALMGVQNPLTTSNRSLNDTLEGLPPISREQWNKIRNYYLSSAPINPDDHLSNEDLENQTLFELQPLTLGIPGGGMTTLIRKDHVHATIKIGDGRNRIFTLNNRLNVMEDQKLNSPPVDLDFDGNRELLTLVGEIFPNNEPSGQIILSTGQSQNFTYQDSLVRPVFTKVIDLNKDGLKDLLVSEYGHDIGSFSWYINEGDSIFTKKILLNQPGALQSHIHDFNGDGLEDIIVLMAQGQEGIFILYNKGNEDFETSKVLEFLPIWGSSYLDLADFDNDGDMDLMVVNGDNADYSMITKSFHGVRIYLNEDGDFREAFFHQMDGATTGLIHDFDEDGDQDIVVTAYFPDFENASYQSIHYLENQGSGDMEFEPFNVEGAQTGRWLVSEKMDYDDDGDMDVLVGSFLRSPTPVPPQVSRKWQRENVNILILKNRSRP